MLVSSWPAPECRRHSLGCTFHTILLLPMTIRRLRPTQVTCVGEAKALHGFGAVTVWLDLTSPQYTHLTQPYTCPRHSGRIFLSRLAADINTRLSMPDGLIQDPA
jgi:hypothetical protein